MEYLGQKKTKPRRTPRNNQPDEPEPVIKKQGPGRPRKIDKEVIVEVEDPKRSEHVESSDRDDEYYL